MHCWMIMHLLLEVPNISLSPLHTWNPTHTRSPYQTDSYKNTHSRIGSTYFSLYVQLKFLQNTEQVLLGRSYPLNRCDLGHIYLPNKCDRVALVHLISVTWVTPFPSKSVTQC